MIDNKKNKKLRVKFFLLLISIILMFPIIFALAPAISIISPLNATYFSTNMLFNISIDQDGSVWYTLDGGKNNVTMSSTNNRNFNQTNLSIAIGGYNLTAYANNSVNN